MSKSYELKFSSFWIYPIIFVFLFIVYSPVIFIRYAFTDDYSFLVSALQHKLSGSLGMLIQGGRPLLALYSKEAFGATGGIGDLGYLRAFGVAGIGVVAALAYRALSQTTLPRSVAIAGALLFGLTPPYQVYAAWTVLSHASWACVLAGAAFFCCDGIQDLRLKWARFFCSILLLTASMATYQVAAMVFWDFAAIAWLLRPNLPSMRSILTSCAVMFSSMVCGYGMVKFLPIILYGSSNNYSRTALVQNYSEKVHWFFQQPLLSSLNIFSINPSIKFAWFIVVIILSGFFLFFGRDLRQTFVRIAIAVFLIPASYVPNLVIAENWATYRTQVALTGLILICTIIAFVGWAQFLQARRWIPALGLVAIAGTALAASRNVTMEFAVPQAIEYHLVENALLRTEFNQNDKIGFNIPPRKGRFSSIARYDEFGVVSSGSSWVPTPMAWLILTEHHSPYAGLFVEDSQNPPKTTVFPGCKKIDLNEILTCNPNGGALR